MSHELLICMMIKIHDLQKTGKKRDVKGSIETRKVHTKPGKNGGFYVENGEVENQSHNQQQQKTKAHAKSSSSGPSGYKNTLRNDSRNEEYHTHSSPSISDSPRRNKSKKDEYAKSNALLES